MIDLDVLGRARVILGQKSVPGRGLRRPVDQLVTSVLPGLILLCSFLITANKILREPVRCLMGPQIKNWPEFIESQCWVQGAFYAESGADLTTNLDRKHQLTYYAYLPYIFGFSSLILFAPYQIYRIIMRPFEVKFDAVYSACKMLAATKDEDTIESTSNRIYENLKDYDTNRVYVTIYIISRFVYIFCLLLVPIFYSLTFRTNFFLIGYKAAFFFVGNNYADVYVKFPINVICAAQLREQAQSKSHNTYYSQCTLSTNMIVQKIIGFIYFMIFFVALPLIVVDTILIMAYFICGTRGYNSTNLLMMILKDSITPYTYTSLEESYRLKKMESAFRQNDLYK
ncbi:MAG: hypothetical protein MHPSP_003276 [Paramarteilia canceri]